MASAGDTCWRCGAPWTRATAPLEDEARSDAERWTNEGGSFRSDATPARHRAEAHESADAIRAETATAGAGR